MPAGKVTVAILHRVSPAPVLPALVLYAVRWVEVSGYGIIYSYTIIHQNKSPEFVNDTPYNIAIAQQLQEGPRMLSNIVDIDPAELRVDLPVTVVFDRVTDMITLPRFRPL